MKSANSSVFLIAIVLSQVAHCQGVPSEAIEGWKWLERDMSTVNGRLSENSSTTRFAFQSGNGKMESTSEFRGQKSEEVILFNKINSFKLSKNKEGDYRLDAIADRNTDKRTKQAIAYIKLSTAVGSVSILDAIESTVFEFSDWKTDDSGESSCNIKCNSTDHDRPFDTLVAVFDSRNHFRVKRYASTMTEPVLMTIEKVAEYGPSSIPIKVVANIKVGVKPVFTEEAIYSDVSKASLPKSEFSLSHYGLPDYAPPSEPWSLQFKISIFTVITVLFGLGLWLFKRDKT